MALARTVVLITFFIHLHIIYGQPNICNNPTVGQNNQNSPVFPSNLNVKSVNNNLFQNENLQKSIMFNLQNQDSSVPVLQQTLGVLPIPLQQIQNYQQLANQQISPISDLQQTLSYQAQPSNQQQLFYQSSPVQQPNAESQKSFIPVAVQQTSDLQSTNPYQNAGSINLQQTSLGNPSAQQKALQMSQPTPHSNLFIPAVSLIPSSGQKVVTNLNGNYLIPIGATPFSSLNKQLATSAPSFFYRAISPTLNAKNFVIPSQNVIPPPNGFDDFALDYEEPYLDYDNLTSLLVSLLQKPKKTSKSAAQANPYAPYTPYKISQGSKSSSLKSLLPFIFNLIKERRESCNCGHECECMKKVQKNVKPQLDESYSQKKDNSIKDEIYNTGECDTEIARQTRAEKKEHKSFEDNSFENDTEYDHCSEEEED